MHQVPAAWTETVAPATTVRLAVPVAASAYTVTELVTPVDGPGDWGAREGAGVFDTEPPMDPVGDGPGDDPRGGGGGGAALDPGEGLGDATGLAEADGDGPAEVGAACGEVETGAGVDIASVARGEAGATTSVGDAEAGAVAGG
jgi:hypothetical protein